jgi:sirohydrochlorin cobaltochelatase
VITAIKAGGFTKVVLEPLMVVAGDHANNDMAGDEEGSWKTAFKAEGIEVQSILEGLGQYNEIQDIYVQHIKDAIQSVK